MGYDKLAFYGGSISGRSSREALDMRGRFQVIQQIMTDTGYYCSGEIVSNASIFCEADSLKKIVPPEEFLQYGDKVALGLQKRRGFLDNTMSLEQQVACHMWSIDEIEKADVCLWDLTRSSTGCGFEIALALAKEKMCFCFSAVNNMSKMLNGCPSHLLMTVQYDESTIASELNRFLLTHGHN